MPNGWAILTQTPPGGSDKNVNDDAKVTGPQESWSELMRALRYRFKDLELLRRALTHRSYVNEQLGEGAGPSVPHHNERLEFLGDAVVGLTVGHLLMERLPAAREGRLTKLRAMIVSERGLSQAATTLGLGDYLRLGKGEALGGGRSKRSLLSDAMEALMGAIYLDGGFEVVQRIVRERLGELVEAAVRGDLDRDFKTRLQELVAASTGGNPQYELLGEHGPDHAKVFEVAVTLTSGESATAQGGSKKAAEQRAAKLLLEQLEPAASENGAESGTEGR